MQRFTGRIVSLFLLKLIPKKSGYDALLKEVMTAYKEGDSDALVSLSSDIWTSYGKTILALGYSYSLEQSLDRFEDSDGNRYKLTYKINESEEMSEEELYDEVIEDSALSDLSLYLDMDNLKKIKGAAEVKLTIYATGGESIDSQDADIYMVKENGSWKLLAMDFTY